MSSYTHSAGGVACRSFLGSPLAGPWTLSLKSLEVCTTSEHRVALEGLMGTSQVPREEVGGAPPDLPDEEG